MHAASTLGAMTASPGRQMAQHQQPTGFAALAREAGLEVNARFGHRLLGLGQRIDRGEPMLVALCAGTVHGAHQAARFLLALALLVAGTFS